MSFENKIKDSMWWWLGKKRPFIINDEYQLELIHIDKTNNSVKIRVTKIEQGSIPLNRSKATEEELELAGDE